MARFFFNSRCPHCGQQREVAVKMIGRKIHCDLCLREFRADDENSLSAAVNDPVQYWIHYTDHSRTSSVNECYKSRDTYRIPR